MKPKVIGQQGSSRFLVHVKGRVDTLESVSRIVDVDASTIYPETKTGSILNRGYWNAVHSLKASKAAVKLVQDYGHLAADEPYSVTTPLQT